MITAQEVADALNEMGIDSKAKLIAFLTPAAIAATLRQKEAALDKLMEDYESAKASAASDNSAARAALEAQIATLKEQLQGG